MLERPEPMVGPAAEVLRHISHEALNAGEGIRRIRSLFHGHHAERTLCNLADVAAELLPVLELLAVRSGATLQFSSQSALPAVAIDRLRIQHVLFTLVQNALEAPTRNGDAPNVRIDLTGDRYGVHVAVEDRGVGIPDEARDHAVSSVLHDQGPGHWPGARVEPRDRRIARGLAGFRERCRRRDSLLSAPARSAPKKRRSRHDESGNREGHEAQTGRLHRRRRRRHASRFDCSDDDGGLSAGGVRPPERVSREVRSEPGGLPGARCAHAGNERPRSAAAIESQRVDAASHSGHRARRYPDGGAGDEGWSTRLPAKTVSRPGSARPHQRRDQAGRPESARASTVSRISGSAPSP